MAESCSHRNYRNNRRWWRSIGPALITACVVFGPGSLLVSANVGATYRFDLLWLLVLTGILMGTYMSMAARIGVVGGATPCTLIARHLNRPAAIVIGLNLFLICATFQFGNNLALAAAAGALLPKIHPQWVIVAVNVLIISLELPPCRSIPPSVLGTELSLPAFPQSRSATAQWPWR